MSKKVILSYILMFGISIAFTPCQCMHKGNFSPEELALTRSSVEDTKMKNSAYLSFYATMNTFLEPDEQSQVPSESAQTLADAKKALEKIQQLDPNNAIFSEFIQAETPTPDQIANTKRAVNEVYFTQYPDDFPKAYSWFYQNQPADIKFIQGYDKIAQLEDKIKTLSEYKNLLKLKDYGWKRLNRTVYHVIKDIMSWLLPIDESDTLPKITAIGSELYKNIIQVLSDITFRFHPEDRTKGIKAYFKFIKGALEKLNKLRANAVQYKKSIAGDNAIGAETRQRNTVISLKNIMDMMNYYGNDIAVTRRLILLDIQSPYSPFKRKSRDEVLSFIKNILDESEYLKNAYLDLIGNVRGMSNEVKNRLFQELAAKGITDITTLSEDTRKSMLSDDLADLSRILQKVKDIEIKKKQAEVAEPLLGEKSSGAGESSVGLSKIQAPSIPTKQSQALSPQEILLNTYQEILKSSTPDISKVSNIVDDIMSWIIPQKGEPALLKIISNSIDKFHLSVIQTLANAIALLPKNALTEVPYDKDYFENLSIKIMHIRNLLN